MYDDAIAKMNESVSSSILDETMASASGPRHNSTLALHEEEEEKEEEPTVGEEEMFGDDGEKR